MIRHDVSPLKKKIHDFLDMSRRTFLKLSGLVCASTVVSYLILKPKIKTGATLYESEDITIKENMEKYSMNIKPEDYFNLDEYGIILFFAHGCMNDTLDEKQIWIDCCTFDDATIQENTKYQKWLNQTILIIRKTHRDRRG